VLLASEPALLEDPVPRVLQWQEYVMGVDEDAAVEPWQDLEVWMLATLLQLIPLKKAKAQGP